LKTASSPRSATQIAAAPVVIALGAFPTGIAGAGRLVASSTRTTLFAYGSASQRAPARSAAEAGALPGSTVVVTLPAGSSRFRKPLSLLNQRPPLLGANVTAVAPTPAGR